MLKIPEKMKGNWEKLRTAAICGRALGTGLYRKPSKGNREQEEYSGRVASRVPFRVKSTATRVTHDRAKKDALQPGSEGLLVTSARWFVGAMTG